MQMATLIIQKANLHFVIVVYLIYFVSADCVEYLGCYKDVQTPLSYNYAPNEYFMVSSSISCIEECHNKGYPYAAYKNVKLCSCPMEEPHHFDEILDSQCDNPFTESNNSCSCEDNLVFTTAISEAGFDTSLIYVGCYVDGPLWRKLRGYGTVDPKMTPKTCVDICKREGFLHAGVQNGDQCYCGDNTLHPQDKCQESECDSVCKGNKTFICGGSWRNSVYNTSTIIPNIDTSLDYVGCYMDRLRRKLTGYSTSNANMTPEFCVDICKSKGFLHAGVQNGDQCYCGDNTLHPEDKRPESDCDIVCKGNKTFICGGSWRNSIYNSSDIVLGVDTSLPYVGCYADKFIKRRLTGYSISDAKLTPKVCLDLCKNKGFLHAGVQNGNQCYCGNNTLNFEDKRPESECDTLCRGNKTFICGGHWRNSIYSTSHIAPTADTSLDYKGCYLIKHHSYKIPHELTPLNSEVTPKDCLNLCERYENMYTGVVNGSQCICRKDALPLTDKLPESECDIVCKSNRTIICGGFWKVSFYKTLYIEPVIDSSLEYKGCYMNKRFGSKFKGYRISHPNMTPKICVDVCKSKGFKNAGVQNGYQCSCENIAPDTEHMRPESECNKACNGNKTFICGGYWTYSVYKTQYAGPAVDNNLDYQGCYADTIQRKLRGDYVAKVPMSPEKCVNICRCKGFSFAGVQYGHQCFCGDLMPHARDRMPETDCNIACTGSPTYLCGGYYRNSIYKTTNK